MYIGTKCCGTMGFDCMTLYFRNRISRRGFLAGAGMLAAGISLSPALTKASGGSTLNFYNWDTYIGETTLDDFKDFSGIDVKMDLFSDNDELFAKLRAGNPGYDLIVPSSDFVERMIIADMLMPLDNSAIPNRVNVEPTFLNAGFDPGRRHSLPYMWGTMGIGYRKSKVDGTPDSWEWLLDSSKYSGKIALLSEAGDVLGAAFKYLGHSLNATNPAIISQAEKLLIKQKTHVKTFAPDNGQDLLLSGEVDLAMEWNGDILQIMEEDPDISYVVPKEGSAVWEDALAIPKGAPHPENAHKFINYLLEPEVGAAIADFIQYATPNIAARKLMPDEYKNNPAIYPSAMTLKSCESSIYKGEEAARLYDEAWTRVLAA